MLAQEFPGERVRVVEGGNSRQQSVENALRSLGSGLRPGGRARCRAAVHRPGDDRPGVRRGRRTGRGDRGRAGGGYGEAGEPRHQNTCKIRATLPREKLVMAQTPQVFRYDLLKRAFEEAREDGFTGTDESQPGGAAGRGGERGAGERPQHQDHQAHRHGSGAPVPARGIGAAEGGREPVGRAFTDSSPNFTAGRGRRGAGAKDFEKAVRCFRAEGIQGSRSRVPERRGSREGAGRPAGQARRPPHCLPRVHRGGAVMRRASAEEAERTE